MHIRINHILHVPHIFRQLLSTLLCGWCGWNHGRHGWFQPELRTGPSGKAASALKMTWMGLVPWLNPDQHCSELCVILSSCVTLCHVKRSDLCSLRVNRNCMSMIVHVANAIAIHSELARRSKLDFPCVGYLPAWAPSVPRLPHQYLPDPVQTRTDTTWYMIHIISYNYI